MSTQCILILTSRGGQGLVSSSQAIRNSLLEALGDSCDVKIVDFFERGSLMGRSLTALYNFFLRHSLRFDTVLMHLLHTVRPDRWTRFHRGATGHLSALVEANRPRAVVITSQFLVTAVSEFMALRYPWIPVCVANIDPGRSCAPVWFHRCVRRHVLPTPETLTAYLDRGFPAENAVVAGFTVRRQFLDASRLDRNMVRRELGLPEDRFIAVIAGSREGYNGIIPLLKFFGSLPGTVVVAACGTNERLRRRVVSMGMDQGASVTALGWNDDMAKYFRAADVVIAKPGKQTTVETLTVETPLISLCYPAIMGQEVGNVDLLRNRGAGFPAYDAAMVMEYVRWFREDRGLMELVRSRLRSLRTEFVKPQAVADAVIELLGGDAAVAAGPPDWAGIVRDAAQADPQSGPAGAISSRNDHQRDRSQ